jgi:hypothetical protein
VTRSKKTDSDVATTISVALFYWPPYVAMSLAARSLWIGLYASGAARRCPVGLFSGGPASMAEAARMSIADTDVALTELVGAGVVEYDQVAMVARLTGLPDKAERPDNGNVLRSWWRRWRTVPRCAVRDRHVRLLRWLLEPMTEDHAEAWAATFGTVAADVEGDGSGNGIRNGSSNRSPNGSNSAGSAHIANRSPNGSPNGRGEGEGEGEDLLFSGSEIAHRSTDVAHARDPAAPEPVPSSPTDRVDGRVLREELRAAGLTNLVDKGLQHYGPRAAGGRR